MAQARILLVKPDGDDPSPVDQSLGAALAARRRSVDIETKTFRRGDSDDLAAVVEQYAGNIDGVVGATGVPESTRLGELSEKHKFLCLVANNNPAVRQNRRTVFHIGVPTRMTAASVADQLLRVAGVRRVFLLHDETEFQKRVADNTASFLAAAGAAVSIASAARPGWPDEVASWRPELTYLVLSSESRALPLAQKLRSQDARMPLLLGRSLLRASFIERLGGASEGLYFVDLFRRGAPRSQEEAEFVDALAAAGVPLPTSNHGFGWDAMLLLAGALAGADGKLSRALDDLESGAEIAVATGRYRFDGADHNGRQAFDPTLLSVLRSGRVIPL
ncbi:MAG TPA: ABC transporter substrate-binding protein [Candidatus Binatia bacterium]|jgi:ABC-type branched-subunit amino acid transport system substrate-binding protein